MLLAASNSKNIL